MTTAERRTPKTVYRQYCDLSDLLWAKYKARILKAHPETQANCLCIHNWGNEEARGLLLQYERKYRRLIDRRHREYNLTEHRSNHNKPPHHFQPLWCRYCQRKPKDRERYLKNYPAVDPTYYPYHVVQHLLEPPSEPPPAWPGDHSLDVQPPRCAKCGTAVSPGRNDPCKCYPVTDGGTDAPH